ncbi:MAG: ABC transporter substrate-binding protein [Deltaproteobacteria bacterium]|nr:ABC transporter substrate-binding protein [Deltaproteobacteria bacterium]MBI3064328.1 ABC transporter substrate-binding protein [Deltaproteobacteria bacterium]
MKSRISAVLLLTLSCLPESLLAQYTKPVYISLPGPGNIQHLAYAVGREKKFYEEMGISNAQIVVLRGNAINVQALVSGTVHFSSAFGPAMQTMFRGEQLRILVQIFNQVPFGLITRPEIKRLEDLRGMKIAVTFGGSTYSLLQALFAKHGLPVNFADYINIPDNASKVLALQQGRVVAAFMAPPTDQPLLKGGFKRLVYGGDEFKDVPFSALLATAKTIREEPDLTERMVKAVVKSLYWIRANREGSIDIIMKNGRLDQREIAASLYDLMRDAFVPALDPEGVMKRAEIEIVLLKERPNFKPEQFIDDRFYKAALKALAREPGAKP